jgi:hypothetical protein
VAALLVDTDQAAEICAVSPLGRPFQPQTKEPPMEKQTTQTVSIKLDLIKTEGGTQARALREDAVEEFAEAMQLGADFPPIVVFWDGSTYWLADGFHRVEAAKRNKYPEITAEVRDGTKRDAILYAVGANDRHGLRRTNADKRRAIEMLLADEEWAERSDRWIADQCKVSHTLVADVRSSREANQLEVPPVEVEQPHPEVAGPRDHSPEAASSANPAPHIPATPPPAPPPRRLGRDLRRRSAKGKRKAGEKPLKGGRPDFDWVVYCTRMGYFVRSIDSLCAFYNSKNHPRANEIRDLLDRVIKAVKELYRDLSSKEAPEHVP